MQESKERTTDEQNILQTTESPLPSPLKVKKKRKEYKCSAANCGDVFVNKKTFVKHMLCHNEDHCRENGHTSRE